VLEESRVLLMIIGFWLLRMMILANRCYGAKIDLDLNTNHNLKGERYVK